MNLEVSNEHLLSSSLSFYFYYSSIKLENLPTKSDSS